MTALQALAGADDYLPKSRVEEALRRLEQHVLIVQNRALTGVV